MWSTEHHFVDDGYMPSLLVMAAAMAARTSRITVGTGVILAPLHNPLRLAEDAATVSLISQGRLELGLGLGWSAVEFDALGAAFTRRGKAMDETIAVLRRAFTGEPFHHHGTVYSLPEVAIRPAAEHPVPIVLGGTAPAALRRAARSADGFFSNAKPDDFASQAAVIRDEWDRGGIDGSRFRWWFYAVIWLCDDPDRGWEEIRDHVWLMQWKYGDMEAAATRRGLARPPLPPPGWEKTARKAVLCGPAEMVAQQVTAVEAAAGVDVRLVARSYFPALEQPRQLEQLQRLGEELLPLRAT